MFSLMHNFYKYMKKRKERKLTLVLIGLDNSGKTTMLATIQGKMPGIITPTWGFNSEKFVDGKYTIDMFDLGGGKRIRGIWKQYMAEVHGCIYMVDAADRERCAEAKEVLHETLADAHLSGKPVLIFANKQDLPGAMSAPEVAEALGLTAVKNNRYNIVGAVALTKEGSMPDLGVGKGFRWLVEAVESDYSKLRPRVESDVAARKADEDRKKQERIARVEKAKAERKAAEAEEERLAAQGGGADVDVEKGEGSGGSAAPPAKKGGVFAPGGAQEGAPGLTADGTPAPAAKKGGVFAPGGAQEGAPGMAADGTPVPAAGGGNPTGGVFAPGGPMEGAPGLAVAEAVTRESTGWGEGTGGAGGSGSTGGSVPRAASPASTYTEQGPGALSPRGGIPSPGARLEPISVNSSASSFSAAVIPGGLGGGGGGGGVEAAMVPPGALTSPGKPARLQAMGSGGAEARGESPMPPTPANPLYSSTPKVDL